MDDILKAIEASNKAFAEFKSANDARLKLLEKNPARADELNEQMKKAFSDIEAHKKTIEALEAKLTNRPGNGGDKAGDPEKAAAIEAHRKAFGGYMRKGTDFSADLEVKAIDWTNPAEGGYAVPKVIDSTIESIVVNISPIRSIASVQQISTTDFHKLVNLRGTQSGWVGELAARPATNAPTLIDVIPPMGELYANPQISQQALDDLFFNAESWLSENVATEFARAENAAFLNGSGVNQPLGIFASPIVSTADEAARPFGSIQYIPTGAAAGWLAPTATVNPADVLFSAVAALKAPYRANARWVTNKLLLFAMASFKDSQGRYVFNPYSAPGVPPTLLNYPVIEAEDMPAQAANAISIAFGDFKRGYLIVDRMGVRVLRDPFSNKPYIGFYTTKRVGGKVVMSEAIKVIRFSVT